MAKTIKIGQASISENGTANGNAGDSTGREVYIVDNYDISNIDPYIVLRPKTNSIASASVAACIAGCNNNNIGYSQAGRNTLYALAKDLSFDLSLVGLCNTDCSAFMTVCAIAGGARITYGSNAPTTANMRTRFSKSGDYDILTDSRYTTMTDYLKAGDILVHENTHAVMVLEDGSDSQSDISNTSSIQTYNIAASVINLTETAATISVKAIQQVNELETSVANDRWSYILECRSMPTGSMFEREILGNKLILTGLTSNTCYMYRVKVKIGDTGLFCSAYKTFNTLKNGRTENTTIAVDDNYIDAVYLKLNDGYTPVTIYINK